MVGGFIKAGRFSTFGCTPPRCVREMGVNLYFSGAQKKRASRTRTCKENVNGAAEDAFISSLRVLSRRRDRVVRVRAA